MKKLFFVTAIASCLAFSSIFAQTATTQKKEKNAEKISLKTEVDKNAIKGLVIDVLDFVTGGKGTIQKGQAEKLVKEGKTIGLLSNGKVYLVSMSDGSSSAAKLIELAGETVAISGKKISKGGVSFIMASTITAMK